MKKNTNDILQDIALIALSILVAIILIKTKVLFSLLTATKESEYIGSFIAGMFFTSVFTTAPAMVALGEIALVNSLWSTAFFGALGSVTGDLIIFRFVKDHFGEHLRDLLEHRGVRRRTWTLFRRKSFRWLTFLMGGLIIASPLPDEIGIGLLGFSKMKTSLFIPLSFTFNFIGIFVIGSIARAL